MEKSHILSANTVVITSLKSCAPLKEDHIDGRQGCVLALSLEDLAAARSLLSFSFIETPLSVPPFLLEKSLSSCCVALKKETETLYAVSD